MPTLKVHILLTFRCKILTFVNQEPTEMPVESISNERISLINGGGYLNDYKSISCVFAAPMDADLWASGSCVHTSHHHMTNLYQPPCLEVEDFRTAGLLCDSYDGAGLDETYDDLIEI